MKPETRNGSYLHYKTSEGALIPFSGHKRTLLITLQENQNSVPQHVLDSALNPDGSLSTFQLNRRKNAAISGTNEMFQIYESRTRITEEHQGSEKVYRLKEGSTRSITICETPFVFENQDAQICSLMMQGKSEIYIRNFLFPNLDIAEQRMRLYQAWSRLATALRRQHILLTIDPSSRGIYFSVKKEDIFTL